jgi:hypothetical protein
VTGDNGADRAAGGPSTEDDPPKAPWHNSTSAVLGASVAGIAAIAIVVTLVTVVARQFDDPEGTQINFVDPSFSSTATSDSATTTTATITSTSPPITSDINAPVISSTPSTTDSSESSPRTTRSRPGRDDDDDDTTSRRRPRLNETRTLYPR